MLRCPQCEFENPHVNNFCQKCGISLTSDGDRDRQQIPIEVEFCSLSEATNNTLLWAIVSLKESVELANVTNDRQGNKFLLPTPENKEHIAYRYLLQDNFDAKSLFEAQNRQLASQFYKAKVVDCYPLRKSYLSSLRDRQPDLFTQLSPERNNSDLYVSEYCNSAGLPTHALPYLILRKYVPIVPQIYDTWRQPDWGVVLLPDRSQWELVSEFWSRSELPLLQIVWFLDEMAKLWQPLKSIGCLKSLLINDNLRIDEDESFCLQQLHLDVDDSPTLKDLAKTWQSCFAKANLSHVDLLQLLDKIISEEIVDVEHLRLELQSFSDDELDPKLPSPYPHLPTMSISPSEPKTTQSEFDSATFESNFFDEIDDINYTSEFEEEATAMIPMQLRNVTEACCTDIGKQRDHNEDFFSIRTKIEKIENNTESLVSVRGLYIVCDGMGGHAAGEVASAMAVENLQTYFKTYWQSELPDYETIERGILLANEAIYKTNLSNSRSGSGRMGTTLIMALLQETQLAIAHVGDSRIYRLSRKQGLEQLTQDHEVGQREINRGVEPEIAYGRPDAYQLTQALGPRENKYVRPEIQFLEITEDCLILLCSDGLSDNEFIEQNWFEHLEPLISSDSNLQDGLFKFVDLADRHNGHDNITAILLKIKLKPDL